MQSTETTSQDLHRRIQKSAASLAARVRELHARHAGASPQDQADVKRFLRYVSISIEKAFNNEPLPPQPTAPNAPGEKP